MKPPDNKQGSFRLSGEAMFQAARQLIARVASGLLLAVYLLSMPLPAMCGRKVCIPGFWAFLGAMRGGMSYSGISGT